VNCTNLSGLALANGGCRVDATCNDGPVLVDCEPSSGVVACTCEVLGHVVGTCQEASLQSPGLCSPTAGCCAAYFGGG
jgi:hypothetical protein